MGKHFILIHGAWHGGWAWEGVMEHLAAAGHTAEAPTLPGHAAEDDRSGISLASYIEAISELLSSIEGTAVLVGHSSAGFLLQSLAEAASAKVERLVFLNAFVLPHGSAQFDHVDPNIATALRGAAEASPDRSVPVIADMIRGVLMRDDSPEMQDAVIARLTPQPLALFTTPIDAEAFQGSSTPRTVIHCRHDTSLPEGTYLQMAKQLGVYDVIEIDGGHETLFTHPERVAKALLEAIG